MLRARSSQGLRTILCVSALLMSSSLSIARATRAPLPSDAGKVLTLNVSTGQDTLDPSATVQLGPASNIDALYARLTQLGVSKGGGGTMMTDPKKIRPWLASSWTVSDRGTLYTFHLRHGLKFANGDPLDAAAVKFTFDRNNTMGLGGIFFLTDGESGNFVSATVKNKYTVAIKLKHADPNILQSWWTPSMGIVDPKVVRQHGGVHAGKTNSWVTGHVAGGSGPWVLTKYQPDTQLVFVPNRRYTAGPRPEVSKLVENVIPSDATLLLEARSGAADVTEGLSYQAVNSLKNDPKVRIITDPTVQMEELEFNDKVAPLNNVTFRKALAFAVPYKQILRRVAYGYGQLFGGPIPPAMTFFNHSISKSSPYAYNLSKAKALLARSKIAMPVTLTDTIEEGNATEEQISVILQGIWSTLGIHLVINKVTPAVYTSSLFAHKTQVFLREDGPGVIDPGYFLDYDMNGCAQQNFSLSNVCLPKAMKLVDQARRTTSKAERQRLFNQVARMWINDCPKVNLYAMKAINVVSKRVTRFVYSQYGDYVSWGVNK